MLSPVGIFCSVMIDTVEMSGDSFHPLPYHQGECTTLRYDLNTLSTVLILLHLGDTVDGYHSLHFTVVQ